MRSHPGPGTMMVAMVQLQSVPGECAGNLERSLAAARAAFRSGARLVVLPELVASGYVHPDRASLVAAAEPLTGETVRSWTELCRQEGGYLCGGLAELDGDRLYNTAVLLGPDGVLLHYRKVHLFAAEKALFDPGNLGFPLADVEGARLGLLICYDLRFPEAVRLLALQGADVVCVPTAWVPGFNSETTDDHGLPPQAHTALTQANLNQVAIVCADQVGSWGDTTFLGASLVAGPYGEVLAGPLDQRAEATALVELDLGAIAASQERGELISPRADRRSDVYAISYAGRDW